MLSTLLILLTVVASPTNDWEWYLWGGALVEVEAAAEPSSVFARPDGLGLPLSHAYAPGGATVDATITLTLVDSGGDPIVNYPREDLWLESGNGGLLPCSDGTVADVNTDANGQTYWTAPLRAGGHSVGEQLYVMLAGGRMQQGLDIVVKTPDLNGDRTVSLPDVVLFTQALGTDDQASDFNNDGVVDLADIVRFAAAIGASCP